jgi:hypothetical protein
MFISGNIKAYGPCSTDKIERDKISLKTMEYDKKVYLEEVLHPLVIEKETYVYS